MPKKIKKGKSIVEAINVNDYILVPNVSIGIFKIGESIDKYTWDYDYIVYKKDPNNQYASDFYEFKEFEDLTIYVDETNSIENIFSEKYCYYQNLNLINHNFGEFKKLLRKNPDNEDYLPVIGIDGESIQNHHVYEFNDLGLQIWVRYNKIKTVICSNNLDINDSE